MTTTLTTRRNRTRRMKSSAQERAERKQAAFNRLKAFWVEYQNMTPEKQAVIEKAAAKLGSYSLRNQILILMQADMRGFEPSAVCPMSAWNKVGRRIKKGEHGLQILVPCVKKGKEAPTAEDGAMVLYGHDFEINDGSTSETAAYFTLGYVFDLSQTELTEVENGLPAPEEAAPLAICA